jgi:chromosomal replication initiator protein
MEAKDKQNPWLQIRDALRGKIDKNSYETWFEPTSYIGQETNSLYIKVPNSYFKDWLSYHYSSVINSCSQELYGKVFNIKFIFDEDSPAFMGKTHLMNAIGHFIVLNNSGLKVLYITTEQFMNDLINHLQYGKVLSFRQKYRNVDVLLIDDIHYLSGKERTKEEFFHTFNHLYDSQKQIVISSDCPPKEIPHLEERFRSRFEWGLIADLKPPDIETRIAILKKKSDLEGIDLPESVALYIADKVHSNIRVLEGYLRRVVAFASLKGEKIDLDLTKEALRSLLDSSSTAVTIEKIQKIVCHQFKIKPSQLKSKNNSPKFAFPRQIAMYLSKGLTKASLPEIGKKFGGKHHTTVIHSIKKIEKMHNEDPEFNKELNNLISYIQ